MVPTNTAATASSSLFDDLMRTMDPGSTFRFRFLEVASRLLTPIVQYLDGEVALEKGVKVINGVTDAKYPERLALVARTPLRNLEPHAMIPNKFAHFELYLNRVGEWKLFEVRTFDPGYSASEPATLTREERYNEQFTLELLGWENIWPPEPDRQTGKVSSFAEAITGEKTQPYYEELGKRLILDGAKKLLEGKVAQMEVRTQTLRDRSIGIASILSYLPPLNPVQTTTR